MRGIAAGRFQPGRGLAALAAGALAAAFAGPSLAAAPVDRGVAVATTGNFSESAKTIPITREAGRQPRVVISMSPAQLPDLAAGDRLRLTAEFQVTGDCLERSPRCVGRPYKYAPVVRGRLVIADGPKATGGPGALRLGAPERDECTQRHPQYEHHCVLTFERAGVAVSNNRLPCPLDACFVNLVADAHSERARNGDVLPIGGLKPNGEIPQDRGRINAIRYRGVLPSAYRPTVTDRLEKRSLRPNFRRRVVISQRLDGLAAGDQISVAARMTTDVSHLRYAVRTSARLILADSPRATRPSRFVKARATLRGELSENNGSNCTQPESRCTTRKVGAGAIRRDVADGAGRPRPLYVNLVTVLGPKSPKSRSGDRIRIRRGEIAVTRFPAAVGG